jgi:formylglycine-generating enzyme required for sulfatase activity
LAGAAAEQKRIVLFEKSGRSVALPKLLHPFHNNGCVAMPLPPFLSESIPSELMRLAREDVESDFHRLVLADWLEQRGDADAIELSRILRMSFGCDRLVLPQDAVAERYRPLAGARRGWFCGPWNGDETSLERLWLASPRAIELPGGSQMELEYIPAGTFMMGSPETEADRRPDETLHEVTISKSFYMGKYPVTQAEWLMVMANNPSHFKRARFPVENVSWDDAMEFCANVKQQTGQAICLPTEAEWEYACRAGTTTPFHFGKALNGTQANCDGNYPYGTTTEGPHLQETSAVGSYPANAWGLHDMHGNVWEWCSDWYGEYPIIIVTDPQGPQKGEYRVLRGGSLYGYSEDCRASYRSRSSPGFRSLFNGFRVLLPLDF